MVVPPRYSEDETALVRRFRVPDARVFGGGGTARLNPAAPDDVLDSLLGIPEREDRWHHGHVVAAPSGRHRRPRLVGVRR